MAASVQQQQQCQHYHLLYLLIVFFYFLLLYSAFNLFYHLFSSLFPSTKFSRFAESAPEKKSEPGERLLLFHFAENSFWKANISSSSSSSERISIRTSAL